MRRDSEIERLAAAIRGERDVWPDRMRQEEWSHVLELATDHGVAPLLGQQLHDSGELSAWPGQFRDALRKGLHQDLLVEQAHRRETCRVLGALASRHVRPVLLKGAALAYTLYPDPGLRPRSDSDLLVRREDVLEVDAVMTDLGYHRWNQSPGDLVMPQADFLRTDAQGIGHTFDLHWKLANPAVFADALSYDELSAAAIRIPQLGEARGPEPVHALLTACIHRSAHHQNVDRLLWLYDIHLLLTTLDRADLQRFVRLAVDRGMGAVCAHGIEQARRRFHTVLPDELLHRLRAGTASEPSAAYVRGDRRKSEDLLSDLRALPGWRQRLSLLWQHLCPPTSYMLARYAVSNRRLLPILYVRRLLSGGRRWLRRPRSLRPS